MKEIFQQFVTLEAWGLFATLCNTLILFLVIKHFLYKPVKNIMAKREQEVEDIYKEANQSKAEAEGLKAEYTEHLSKAKDEAAEIVKNSTRKATLKSEEILKESSLQASQMMRKAEENIEQEKKKALNEIKDEISGLAVMIASKVIEKDISEDDHKRLVEDFISKVG